MSSECENTANDKVSTNEISDYIWATKEFEPSLPLLSKKWLLRRGRLAGKNKSRTMPSQTYEKMLNDKNRVIGLKRSEENYTRIEDNIEILQQQIEKETNLEKQAELHALKEVGKFLIEFGPIVLTQCAGEVYEEAKNNYVSNFKGSQRNAPLAAFSSHFHIILTFNRSTSKGKLILSRIE